MKKITFALILIIALILLSPPIVGMQARSALQDALQQTASQTGDYLQIRLEAYESGWFEGQGKIRISLNEEYLETLFDDDTSNELRQRLREGLLQQVQINHGPVIFSDGVNLELGQAVTVIDASSHPDVAALLAQTGNEYLLKLSMDLGFSGNSDLHLDAPAFTARMEQDKGNGELIFAGAQARGNLDFSGMQLVMNGQMNGFSVRGDDGEAVIERTVLRSDMAYPDSDPYGLGEASVAIDRVVAMQADAIAFDLSQARFDFASTKQGDALRLQADYRIAVLQSGGATYEDLQVTLVADQVARDAMRQLQNLDTNLAASEDTGYILDSLRAPIHQLLAAGLTLQVAPAKFLYDTKPFSAKLTVRSQPQALPPLDAFQLEDIAMWMALLEIEADLNLHRELATELLIPQIKQQLLAGVPADTEVDEAQLDAMARAQAPLMLGALIGQGIFREDQDNLAIAAQFSNGAMSVNGNPFPLDSLLMQP